MPARPKILGVSQLSPAQNERLRRAMLAYKREHCDDNVTKLAERLGRAQPSISDFLNRKGGASYETAVRFAALVGDDVTRILGPREPRAGEDLPLAPRQQPSAEAPDLTYGTFLLKVAELPGLKKWLDHHPGAATVSEVCRAIQTFETTPGLARASDGQPVNGWAAFLDDVRNNRLTASEEPQEGAARTISAIETLAPKKKHRARKRRGAQLAQDDSAEQAPDGAGAKEASG